MMEEEKSFENKNTKARASKPIGNMDFGKVPPQATDVEEVVLGALMLEKNAFNAVSDILKPEVFYKPAHREIYKAISDLNQRGEAIDIITVKTELESNNKLEIIGGAYYIAQLTSNVGSAANIEFHAKILVEKFIKRELISISSSILTESFEESSDVFDVLNKAEKGLYDVAQGSINRTNAKMSELIREAIQNIEDIGKKENFGGVPSGFTNLDEITSGWQPSNLIIVAARPGMGKTAFAMAMARNAAVDNGIPVAVFSLEMDAIELVYRLISSETGLKSDVFKKGNLDEKQWTQLHTNISKLSDAPIFINDTPSISVFDFRSIARRLKQQHNIGMIIVDYLQLMRGSNETKGMREQEISLISRTLKAVAKELRIPIIALSQLSRAVESQGGDKIPQLSHLRESGSIEQDADLVCFIYRPEYYQILQDENGNSLQGVAQIIIAKNRHGATKTVNLGFAGDQIKFYNLETEGYSGFGGSNDFSPATIERSSKAWDMPPAPSSFNKFDDIDDTPF